jgi:hypothetical protein
MEISWRVHVPCVESGPLVLIRSTRSVLLAKTSEPITLYHAVKLPCLAESNIKTRF